VTKGKEKIVLYNPKAVFYTMPLGLLAIASGLDRDKYEICIIDGQLEEDAVARVLDELDGALLLGVTVLTGVPIGDALSTLRAAKSRYPERALMPMEVFPSIDHSLIPVEQYFQLKGRRQLDYISSTGCLFRCAFCADPFVYKRGWQAIGSERVADEIEQLWRKYRFEDLNFQDETFFTYKNRVAEIAEQFLKRDMSFTWAATMRADQCVRLSEDIFRLCVRSGMRRVLVGVESGSPAMLKRIRKDTTVEQIISSAEMCARNGVAVIFSFIVGFPGESYNEVMQTVSLIKTLRAMSPDSETPIFYYKPYPGSEISAGIATDMPTSLDQWAQFDYAQGTVGSWVPQATYEFMERFKFYNRFAWGNGRIARRPLQILARWRCQRNWFDWPLEKAIVQRLRPGAGLS